MILESDSVWKESMERKIHGLQAGLNKVAKHFSLSDIIDEDDEDDDEEADNDLQMPQSGQLSPLTEKHAPHNFELIMDPNSGPAAIPGSVVSPILAPEVEQNRAAQDVITKGVVTVEQAQGYLEVPLDLRMIEPLRRQSIRLDKIRADWRERFARNKYVGNYPRKGIGLHYHFAKLHLYSIAFRGVGRPGFKAPDVALDIDELANSALLSATSILRVSYRTLRFSPISMDCRRTSTS